MRTSCFKTVVALLVLGGFALAQSVVVPNANATVRGTGVLNTITRETGNPRTYLLGIAAPQLTGIPIGSVINGLSFRSNVTANNPALWPAAVTTWSPYEITIGNALPLTTWVPTFMTNMFNARVVRSVYPMSIQPNTFANNPALPAPQPNAFGNFFFDFHRSFSYNGGNLAILMTNPGSDNTTAEFLDAVQSDNVNVRALSATGFHAPTGTDTLFSIPRIHYGYGDSCLSPADGRNANLVLSNNVTGGGATTFAVTSSRAGATGFFVIGFAPARLFLPNTVGCYLYVVPNATLPFALDANGTFFLTLTFPAGASAVVYVQAAVISTGYPGGYTTTNGVTLTISP
jgi:hypothetical protein